MPRTRLLRRLLAALGTILLNTIFIVPTSAEDFTITQVYAAYVNFQGGSAIIENGSGYFQSSGSTGAGTYTQTATAYITGTSAAYNVNYETRYAHIYFYNTPESQTVEFNIYFKITYSETINGVTTTSTRYSNTIHCSGRGTKVLPVLDTPPEDFTVNTVDAHTLSIIFSKVENANQYIIEYSTTDTFDNKQTLTVT